MEVGLLAGCATRTHTHTHTQIKMHSFSRADTNVLAISASYSLISLHSRKDVLSNQQYGNLRETAKQCAKEVKAKLA